MCYACMKPALYSITYYSSKSILLLNLLQIEEVIELIMEIA